MIPTQCLACVWSRAGWLRRGLPRAEADSVRGPVFEGSRAAHHSRSPRQTQYGCTVRACSRLQTRDTLPKLGASPFRLSRPRFGSPSPCLAPPGSRCVPVSAPHTFAAFTPGKLSVRPLAHLAAFCLADNQREGPRPVVDDRQTRSEDIRPRMPSNGGSPYQPTARLMRLTSCAPTSMPPVRNCPMSIESTNAWTPILEARLARLRDAVTRPRNRVK